MENENPCQYLLTDDIASMIGKINMNIGLRNVFILTDHHGGSTGKTTLLKLMETQFPIIEMPSSFMKKSFNIVKQPYKNEYGTKVELFLKNNVSNVYHCNYDSNDDFNKHDFESFVKHLTQQQNKYFILTILNFNIMDYDISVQRRLEVVDMVYKFVDYPIMPHEKKRLNNVA
jgi:energy-coupling factor transporter ATP-binding protein EcfA2